MLSEVGVFSPLPELAKENSAGLPLGVIGPVLVLPTAGCLKVGLPMLGADRRASICFGFSEVWRDEVTAGLMLVC